MLTSATLKSIEHGYYLKNISIYLKDTVLREMIKYIHLDIFPSDYGLSTPTYKKSCSISCCRVSFFRE